MTDSAGAVEWLLMQQEPEARRVAVAQLTKVQGREVAELLVRALGDEDWRVRKEAVLVAPACESRDEVVSSLVAALDEKVNIGLRNAAVEALVAIGPEAVAPVVAALDRLDADGRKLAVEVLGGVPDARSVYALARALDDEDANVRMSAAEALGQAALVGEDARQTAIIALEAVLRTSEAMLKLAALDALSRLGAQLPWRVCEPYANDPLLRRYAIAAAAGSREIAAVSALAKAVGDPSRTISREAAAALGDTVAFDITDTETLRAARQAVRESVGASSRLREMAYDHEDTRLRGAAFVLLGLLGDPADVPLLVDGLAEDELAERSELALRLIGPSAVGPLLAAGRTAPPSVRAAILSLVPSLAGEGGAELQVALRDALEESSSDVRASAIKALAHSGDATDLARIAPLIVHADPRLAAAAAAAVGLLAPRHVADARAIAARAEKNVADAAIGCVLLGALAAVLPLEGAEITFLSRSLAHDEPRTRRAAVEALAQGASGGAASAKQGDGRGEAEGAADMVAFALADEERDVQLAAVRALGKLGRAEPLCNVVGAARDPELVAAALRALGEADPERAFRAARPLVKHLDPSIACAAVEALGRLVPGTSASSATPSDRQDALFEALEHPEVEVVKVALAELATALDARTLARLGLCLDHGAWEVRRTAAELLGQEGGPSARALLRARFEREKDAAVREAIARAVSSRTPSMVAGPDSSSGHPSSRGPSRGPAKGGGRR